MTSPNLSVSGPDGASVNSPSGRSAVWVTAVIFVASLATLVQSYLLVKLFFVALFLLAAGLNIGRGARMITYPRLVVFYLAISVAGFVWSMVGMLHNGNNETGVFDALRLYCLWSFAFVVLYSLLRSQASLGAFHAAMVTAGVLISAINFFGLYDQIAGLGLFPEAARKEMEQYIGIHEGYIQITSQNIGALFLVIPYLLTLQFRADAGEANSKLTKVSLILCVILAALSGRRALWLVVALTPCVILLLSFVTKQGALLRVNGRRLLVVYSAAGVLALGLWSLVEERLPEAGSLSHLKDAFSSEDVRTIQEPYLIESFQESPLLGSGFGAYAGYQRSDERPWTYELTYHQLLFNLGAVGVLVLGAVYAVYLGLVVKLFRRSSRGSAIAFGLLVGFCCLLIGAYSNPYLRSFDFLFLAGVLPYLSTFQSGFDPAPRRMPA